MRQRGDFLPADADADDPDEHADPPSSREALLSLGMLVVGLAAVVGLATVVSPAIEDAVAAKSDRRQKQTVTTPDEGQSHGASLGVQTAKEGWHDDTLRDRP